MAKPFPVRVVMQPTGLQPAAASPLVPPQPAIRVDPMAEIDAGGKAAAPAIAADEVFVAPTAGLDIEAKIARAEGVLRAILLEGRPLAVAFSSGKDSSVVMNLALSVASKMRAEGLTVPPIVVTHADTGVENPEMVSYAQSEMRRIRTFCDQRGIEVRIEVSQPNKTDHWAVRTIGGRALPSFPGTNRDCTTDWKIGPMEKLRRRVMKELGFGKKDSAEPVTLVGTRFTESAERAKNMAARGDSDIELRRGEPNGNKPGYLYLSPIAWWSTEDVWEYLAMAQSKAIETYSDFEDTMRIYADAMGTSCVIVADDIAATLKRPACGARTGCSICTMVSKDASLENMIERDERYSYMRNLNKLQKFLVATRWDWNRRSWVGRTIKNGYIAIAPDAYSPKMMEELLRYCMTLDADEIRASRNAGLDNPRFQFINMERLFIIDTMWAFHGFHKPYHALKIYDEIYNKGMRFPIPEIEPFPETKPAKPKYLYVGDQWGEGRGREYTALRDPVAEMFSESNCMGTKETASGLTVMDMNVESAMSIEIETAMFLLEEELPQLLARHDDPKSSPAESARYYLRLGMLSIKSGMEDKVDHMLRRAGFKHQMGIAGEVDREALLARAITDVEMKAHLKSQGIDSPEAGQIAARLRGKKKDGSDADTLLRQAAIVAPRTGFTPPAEGDDLEVEGGGAKEAPEHSSRQAGLPGMEFPPVPRPRFARR